MCQIEIIKYTFCILCICIPNYTYFSIFQYNTFVIFHIFRPFLSTIIEKGGHTTALNVTYSLFLVYHYLISSVILCLI